jgi:hypothetical protein
MVFALTPPASPAGTWREAVLHNFRGIDGFGPKASLVIGGGGVLYRTTFGGGTSGRGTVFALTPPVLPGTSWTEAVLHSFTAGPSDGADPQAAVVIGRRGALYGTTYFGGTLKAGTVFASMP